MLQSDNLDEAILPHACDDDLSLDPVSLRDEVVRSVYLRAHGIAERVVKKPVADGAAWQSRLDDLLTSRTLGIPVMLLLLTGVFWLTLEGANVPSRIMAHYLFTFEDTLSRFFMSVGTPAWLHGVLVLGMYRTAAWVVSVMLPPMAIFFPLFTIMEDFGYLPRVAFNLDRLFRKSGAHGKQALTMCMGFGCNAAGVVSCRIIESPRERLVAILTNNFVPCNGRFPTLLALSTAFIGSGGLSLSPSLCAAISVLVLVLLGIQVTFLVSYILTRTLLKGVPSAFVLELPPYRPPQIMQVLIRSVFDRTVFVLGRAVAMAAPAGAITWMLANTYAGGMSLFGHAASFLDPVGRLLGFDGTVLMAFIAGLPANEIVLPITVMGYLSTGSLTEIDSLEALRHLLVARGWTVSTAISVMLFSLLHFPCSTTLWTVYRESHSLKWTVAAALIPTLVACVVLLLFRLLISVTPLGSLIS